MHVILIFDKCEFKLDMTVDPELKSEKAKLTVILMVFFLYFFTYLL